MNLVCYIDTRLGKFHSRGENKKIFHYIKIKTHIKIFPGHLIEIAEQSLAPGIEIRGSISSLIGSRFLMIDSTPCQK